MKPDAGGSSADPATTEPATERERLSRLFHDMRARLTVIIGCSELLVNDEVDPISPKQREFLGDIPRCRPAAAEARRRLHEQRSKADRDGRDRLSLVCRRESALLRRLSRLWA